MADSSGRHKGNDQVLYVATSEPTTPEDEADGAYTLVGLLISNDLDGTGNVLTAADKAVSGFTSSLVGTRSYTINVEAHRKNVEDDGQAIIRDAWVDGTDTIYWLITTAVAGDTCAYGEATVTAYGEANPTDEFATMTATLNGQGAPTFDTVPGT